MGRAERSEASLAVGHVKASTAWSLNYLAGAGDDVNAVLVAAGCNFRRLLEWLDLSLSLIVAALAAKTDPKIPSAQPERLLRRRHGMA
jgi:hypothetical protein